MWAVCRVIQECCEAFFELLQRWAADNEGTSRTTDDFIELAETVAGERLDELFDAWLFGDPPPATPSAACIR